MRSRYHFCVFFFSLFAIVYSLPVNAQEWRFIDSLHYPRYQHTATKLADGRVLVAGGRTVDENINEENRAAEFAPPEIYDPRTGKWSVIGRISYPRYGHAAILLRDGRVLVDGGRGMSNTQPPAEIYNPATDSWSVSEALDDWAHYHRPMAQTAQLTIRLRDGRVFMTASQVDNRLFGLYDPTREECMKSWIDPGFIPQSYLSLPDGRVMAMGWNMFNIDSASQRIEYNICAMFDTGTGSWSYPSWDGSSPFPRDGLALLEEWKGLALSGFGMALLGDGRVLVAGGYDMDYHEHPYYSEWSRAAMLFDPATSEWTSADSMLPRRFKQSMNGFSPVYERPMIAFSQTLTLPDGNVLVIGGTTDSLSYEGCEPGSYAVDAQIYDYRKNSWRYAGTLNEERVGNTLTLLDDGSILVTGGRNCRDISRSCEVYKPRYGGNSND